MNITLFILLLFGIQLFCWFISRRTSKDLSTQMDYFLAGKRVQFFPLMMTFFAGQVGGGLILGSAEEAYKFGWAVILYPLGAACGLMALGTSLGERLALKPVKTVAQIFEITYGSALLKKLASVISMTTLFIILVAQVIASKTFLTSVGLNNIIIFIAIWSIIIAYTSYGGLNAVISTDYVLAGFFSVALILSFIFAMFNLPDTFSFTLEIDSNEELSSKMYGWLLMPLLFIFVGQDMAQKCFAGKSPATVRKASFWAGICTLVVCTVPIFFGVLAKNIQLPIPLGASVLIETVRHFTNPVLTACVGCAIMAAIISTSSALINAISSNLSNDFNFSFLQSNRNIQLIKIMTVAISALAIICSFYFNNIVNLLIQSFEISVCCLLVPILFGLFNKQFHPMTATFSMTFGLFGFCLFRLYPLELPEEPVNLLFSLIGFYTGRILYPSSFKNWFTAKEEL